MKTSPAGSIAKSVNRPTTCRFCSWSFALSLEEFVRGVVWWDRWNFAFQSRNQIVSQGRQQHLVEVSYTLLNLANRRSSVCTLWPLSQLQFAYMGSSVQAEQDKCGRPGQNSNYLQDEPERPVKNDHSDNDQYDGCKCENIGPVQTFEF